MLLFRIKMAVDDGRAKSPLHVHVEKDTPVHVHVNKGKKRQQVNSY